MPVGFAEQPRFVNAVVELETDLTPRELLDGLLGIEHEFGRDRQASFQNGPRTLDLDILLFDGLTVSEPGLEIPHPRLAERAFVLIPLCEVAPVFLDVSRQRTVSQLLQDLRPGSESKTHAVVPIEGGGWRAGAYRDGVAPGEF
jgi:2-amino-4-hydroxy-6-hydroxymethyldihydropteridine diphosphokinase